MLFKHDATHYGVAIKDGSYSVKLVTEYAFENIHRLNPQLNAVNYIYQDQALARAKRLDKHLATLSSAERRKLSPFFGVPILLKDLGQLWKGSVSSQSSKLFLGKKSTTTDDFIRIASEAGMIFVGRSNTSEFGLKTVSDSLYFGSVRNPHNLAYNPGGSSGGAAASAKSGMVPLAAASDAGGSIRVPASDCGLIGLKPSHGRIAASPQVLRRINGLSGNFFIARSVRDIFNGIQVFQAMPNPSRNTLPIIQEDELKAIDRPLKIAYTTDHPRGQGNSSDAIQAIEMTVQALRNLGHEVEAIALPVDYNELMDYYYMILTVEIGKNILRVKESGQQIQAEDIDPLAWLCYQTGPHIPAFAYSDFVLYQDELIAQMDRFYEQYDVLLTPTTSAVAQRNDALAYSQSLVDRINRASSLPPQTLWELAHEAFDHVYQRTSYCPLMNITGQPAISLPLYENADGLPLGSQFAAKRGQELLLIQLAKQLESHGYLKANCIEL